jgi:hypothetical protein
VRTHLGAHWLSKVVYTGSKQVVCGDLLIDDKPYELLTSRRVTGSSSHTFAVWKQVLFSQPYNVVPSEFDVIAADRDYFCDSQQGSDSRVPDTRMDTPRLEHWSQWRDVLLPLLGYKTHSVSNKNNSSSSSTGSSGATMFSPLLSVSGQTECTNNILLNGCSEVDKVCGHGSVLNHLKKAC